MDDRERLTQICKECYPGIFKYIHRRISHQADADDLVMQVFADIAAQRAMIVSLDNYRGYIYKMAANQCRKYYREKATHDAAVSIDDVDAVTPDVSDVVLRPDDEYVFSHFEEALTELSSKEQQLYISHFIEKTSLADIARETGEKYENVKKATSRLQKKIREWLFNLNVNKL